MPLEYRIPDLLLRLPRWLESRAYGLRKPQWTAGGCITGPVGAFLHTRWPWPGVRRALLRFRAWHMRWLCRRVRMRKDPRERYGWFQTREDVPDA